MERALRGFVPAALLISLIIWLTYSQTLTLGFTGWDTLALIEWSHDNLVRSPLTLFTKPLLPGTSYYRPLSNLSYALDWAWFGIIPAGYHMVDVFIHWATCLGLVVLGYQASRRIAVGLLAGALLALQPVFGTMIANITYRQDAMATLWIVWALIFTNAYLQASGWRAWAARILSWLAFAMALGVKETGIVALPLILALVFYRRRLVPRGIRTAFLESVPYLILTGVYAVAHTLVAPRSTFAADRFSGVDVWLPLVYLQEIISGQTANVAVAGVLTAAFLAAIGILIVLAFAGPKRATRTGSAPEPNVRFWIALCVAATGLPLLLYVVSDIPEFVERYAYVVAAPLALLVALLLLSGLPRQPRGLALAGMGAKVVLVGIILLWLPRAPLFGLDRAWLEREATAAAYLAALDRAVAQLPDATTIQLENVPPKLISLNNLKSWLDLRWSAKQIRLGSQAAAKKPRGQPTLSVTPLAEPGMVRIEAIYHLTED